jgi:asparagine synthase (glutamine-hydrolysing)
MIANEAELAAATARQYDNIEHVLVESSGESPLRWLDHNFRYQQQPMTNLANAAWGTAINRGAAARGAKVLFKGGLGNLTTSYAGLEWLSSLVSDGRLATAARHARDLARDGLPMLTLGVRVAAPFVPPPLWRLLRRVSGRVAGLSSYSALNPQRFAEIAGEADKRSVDTAERPSIDPLAARLRALRRGDRGGNAYKAVLAEWGLSIRDPTADRRVVEYCLAVPVEEFVRGGVHRSLARRVFADRLPSEVTEARVRGCQSADWYEALDRARPEIEQELTAIMRCPQARDALDAEWISETLSHWPSDRWNEEAAYRRYRLGLLRGISAGHFMRKVAGTN